MTTNLTPMYMKADKAFREAKTDAEKIAALEEMHATIPKHKGTEKMQADIKHRLSALREAASHKKVGGGIDIFHVDRHGAGQVALVGPPNCGKSALVGALTKAHVNVAPYPFSTHAPVPGMMPFEDIQIQLIDLPPVTAEGVVPGMIGTLRNANILLVVVDLSAPDLLDQVELCLSVLEGRGLVPPSKTPPEGGATKPMILAATKADLAGAMDNFAALKELYGTALPMIATSAETFLGFDAIARHCFELLDVVRVYSKEPGKPVDRKAPFILKRGSTVLDMAAAVHRDLAANLKRARGWGANLFDGQPVEKHHVLSDKDVIELHV